MLCGVYLIMEELLRTDTFKTLRSDIYTDALIPLKHKDKVLHPRCCTYFEIVGKYFWLLDIESSLLQYIIAASLLLHARSNLAREHQHSYRR